MASILIKHQTGSKANQTEVFDLANFTEINFGRGDSVEVKYGDQDDLVSRQHAKITRDDSNPNQFFIIDSSRNGTFVNGLRINAVVPAQINHGDRIQFGTGGSEFIFELDPPPSGSARQTRIISDTNNTREVPPGTREIQPRSEGRLTSLERRIEEERGDMEQRLADERQALNARINQESIDLNRELDRERTNSRWRTIYIGLALFVIVVLSGTGFYIWKEKTENKLETSHDIANDASKKLTKIEAIKTPEQIAQTYSQSVVLIENKWELIDKLGRKVYLACVRQNKDKWDWSSTNGCLPVYVRTEKSIEPWLTAKPEEGLPIAGIVQGTGFVISEQGFILTNLHIYKPWDYLDSSVLSEEGMIVDLKTGSFEKLNPDDKEKLAKWTAKKSAMFKGTDIFQKSLGGNVTLEGNSSLKVTFPKTTVPYPARLVRESNQADAALLRIDVPGGLQQLSIDVDNPVVTGQTVTVLGYPGISAKTFVEIHSADKLSGEANILEVPEPTLTSGWIGKVIKISRDTKSSNVVAAGEMERYQLTINATGLGNSGGPVFNDQGQVIGIFSNLRQQDGITVSFAVPIQYGRDLKMNREELK